MLKRNTSPRDFLHTWNLCLRESHCQLTNRRSYGVPIGRSRKKRSKLFSILMAIPRFGFVHEMKDLAGGDEAMYPLRVVELFEIGHEVNITEPILPPVNHESFQPYACIAWPSGQHMAVRSLNGLSSQCLPAKPDTALKSAVVSAQQAIWASHPFSTRVFISAYAASMSLRSDAASVAVPGRSFTCRMNLPVPCNKRAGSGSAAP